MDNLERTIVLKAKALLPIIHSAINEAESGETKEAMEKLHRFKKWKLVLEKWQEENVAATLRTQRFEELRDLLMWDDQLYG